MLFHILFFNIRRNRREKYEKNRVLLYLKDALKQIEIGVKFEKTIRNSIPVISHNNYILMHEDGNGNDIASYEGQDIYEKISDLLDPLLKLKSKTRFKNKHESYQQWYIILNDLRSCISIQENTEDEDVKIIIQEMLARRMYHYMDTLDVWSNKINKKYTGINLMKNPKRLKENVTSYHRLDLAILSNMYVQSYKQKEPKPTKYEDTVKEALLYLHPDKQIDEHNINEQLINHLSKIYDAECQFAPDIKTFLYNFILLSSNTNHLIDHIDKDDLKYVESDNLESLFPQVKKVEAVVLSLIKKDDDVLEGILSNDPPTYSAQLKYSLVENIINLSNKLYTELKTIESTIEERKDEIRNKKTVMYLNKLDHIGSDIKK